jgi:aspartate-semialdehyde dehydrogenase
MRTNESARGSAQAEVHAPWGWTDAHRAQHVSVIGATGAVGRELCTLLVQAKHPLERIHALARAECAIEAAGARLSVRALPQTRDGLHAARTQLAFLCTPSEISLELAPALCELGTRVIDLSSAFRMRADVPLVVPEINPQALAGGARLIANPNCTTVMAAMPLAVIERICGLEEVVVVSFQAASGAGVPGLETLQAEAREASGLPVGQRRASPFPAQLALNVIPGVAAVDELGISGEEHKVIAEMRKILGRPGLVVEATTTRVPVERCHSVAVHVKTARDYSLPELIAALRAAPGVEVTDDPHGPRPRECAGLDPVFVGRIRAGTRGARSLCFFAVGDQIRKGAALNALQIAAALTPES